MNPFYWMALGYLLCIIVNGTHRFCRAVQARKRNMHDFVQHIHRVA